MINKNRINRILSNDNILLCIALILFSTVVVPYRLAFGLNVTGTVFIIDRFIDGFFLCDIIVSFNTAVIDPSTELLIPNRLVIAMFYFRCW